MLAKRIIPTILVRGRTLVKGEGFNSWRSIGHAAQAARVHATRGVDELLILDISGGSPDLQMVTELSEACFIPITCGGGVRTLKDIDQLLRAGADKVSICTGAIEVPGLIYAAATRFGSQAIVACVEYRNLEVTTHAGTRPHGMTPRDWANRLEGEGAGEILLSCVERDGTMTGYDLETLRHVALAVGVPVIVSGGCASYDDMLAAFRAGADACAAGALFAFTDAVPREAAHFLASKGMNMRLP